MWFHVRTRWKRQMLTLYMTILSLKGAISDELSTIPSLGAAIGGSLPSNSFSASSQFNILSPANKGRLNLRGSYAAWIPAVADASPWIQVDLKILSDVLAVVTTGRGDGRPLFTRAYSVSYSVDGSNFDVISKENETKIFTANVNKNSPVTNYIDPPVQARFVRIHPTECSDDGPCALRLDILGYHACKDNFKRFGPHCYFYFSTARDYSYHQMNCMTYGGNLASITSEEENDFISELSKNSRSWIGGKLDAMTDKHFWIDGSEWRFTKWRKREPNRTNQRELCLETNFVRPGLWNDHFCHFNKTAVCEKVLP